MNSEPSAESSLETVRFCFRLMTIVVALGGLALLAIATSAAMEGLAMPALFIGACGLALLATVAWVHRPVLRRPPAIDITPRHSRPTKESP